MSLDSTASRVRSALTVLPSGDSRTGEPLPRRNIADSFATPKDAIAVHRAVRRILSDVLEPTTPFNPPRNSEFSVNGLPAESIGELLEEVHAKVVAHAVHPRHPMALAHMVPPPSTVSVVADLIIGALNQCAFVWEQAPAAAALEARVVRWLADRLGFGAGAGGLLTSGGTMSNYTAALLAWCRAKRTGKVGEAPVVVASDQAHLSIDKAAVMLGLGRQAVIRVPTDRQGRTVPGSLTAVVESCRRRGQTPFLVVCTAGTSSTGTLEPLAEVLRAARAQNAWCHVDAAHGGFVSLARGYRATASAWVSADSVSWDAHKSLYASYAVGALLLRDPNELEELRFHSDYALRPGGCADAGELHLEGSRRMEALKLWMCIRHFGIDGYRDLAELSIGTARHLAERIRASRHLVLMTEPDTNIVCFRFQSTDLATDEEVAEVNLAVHEKLFRTGGPLLSVTRVGGRVSLRAVVLNPAFTHAHADEVVERVTAAGWDVIGNPSSSQPAVSGAV